MQLHFVIEAFHVSKDVIFGPNKLLPLSSDDSFDTPLSTTSMNFCAALP